MTPYNDPSLIFIPVLKASSLLITVFYHSSFAGLLPSKASHFHQKWGFFQKFLLQIDKSPVPVVGIPFPNPN